MSVWEDNIKTEFQEIGWGEGVDSLIWLMIGTSGGLL
jgi:hypothetical protein